MHACAANFVCRGRLAGFRLLALAFVSEAIRLRRGGWRVRRPAVSPAGRCGLRGLRGRQGTAGAGGGRTCGSRAGSSRGSCTPRRCPAHRHRRRRRMGRRPGGGRGRLAAELAVDEALKPGGAGVAAAGSVDTGEGVLRDSELYYGCGHTPPGCRTAGRLYDSRVAGFRGPVRSRRASVPRGREVSGHRGRPVPLRQDRPVRAALSPSRVPVARGYPSARSRPARLVLLSGQVRCPGAACSPWVLAAPPVAPESGRCPWASAGGRTLGSRGKARPGSDAPSRYSWCQRPGPVQGRPGLPLPERSARGWRALGLRQG